MTLYNNINGVDVPMSAEDEAATRAMWANNGQPPPPRRLVRKSLLIKRVHDAGKLAEVIGILNLPENIYALERFRAPDWPNVYFDDPETVAIISAVGLNPNIILAPGDD